MWYVNLFRVFKKESMPYMCPINKLRKEYELNEGAMCDIMLGCFCLRKQPVFLQSDLEYKYDIVLSIKEVKELIRAVVK
jgi:hypothetical protein